MIGHWLVGRWQSELAYPGALQARTQRTDATALLGWAELLGQFMARHAFIIMFTILLLFFLYREGNSLTDASGGCLVTALAKALANGATGPQRR
ncbi:MAG TPA: hypothetical protein VN989_07910 [Casimicrobiaceae bacterium]|nr:hypothetical protein [Casimicrobiaceae bacterium]